MSRLLASLLFVAALAASAPAAAATPLPKVPADTEVVVYVANPARALLRAEATAARVGLAPPGAAAGWLLKSSPAAWALGAVDLTRPVYAVLTAADPKRRPKADAKAAAHPLEEIFGDLLLYLPLTKTADPAKIVAGLSDGSTKLRSVKDRGYLVVSRSARALRAARRTRALDAEAVRVASSLDVAALLRASAVDRDLARTALGTDRAADTVEDRALQALIEVVVELSEASSPAGAWAVTGLEIQDEGLRLTSQSRVVAKSLIGGWLLKTPKADPTHLVGHPPGPMIGGVGMRLDAASTVEVAKAVYARTMRRLSKADRAALAPLGALGPALEKAWRAHPAISVVMRPGGAEPRIAAVLPRIPDALRSQIPNFEARPADPKAGLPKHGRVLVDADTPAYVIDLEDRSLVAVGYAPPGLKAAAAAAAKGADPTEGDARYARAREALGAGLILEAYLDPALVADLALRDPATAPFRPLARLLGRTPPIVLAALVEGDVLRTDLFVPEAVLAVLGMGLSAMEAGAGPP